MPVDVTRYAIITNEYRNVYARDSLIASRYKKARVLEIDTNLREADYVTDLLQELYDVVGSVRRRFEVIVSGTSSFTIDQMATGPIGVLLTIPEFDAENLKSIVTRMVIDEGEDQTVLEVWG